MRLIRRIRARENRRACARRFHNWEAIWRTPRRATALEGVADTGRVDDGVVLDEGHSGVGADVLREPVVRADLVLPLLLATLGEGGDVRGAAGEGQGRAGDRGLDAHASLVGGEVVAEAAGLLPLVTEAEVDEGLQA